MASNPTSGPKPADRGSQPQTARDDKPLPARDKPAATGRSDQPASGGHRKLPVVAIALAVVALVAAGGGYYWWQRVQAEELAETRLVLYGNIDVRQVNLAFKVAGRVETLAVDEGDHVNAGAGDCHARQALLSGRRADGPGPA